MSAAARKNRASSRAWDINKVDVVLTALMFIFIGAHPPPDWLAGIIERDDRGFIMTAANLVRGDVRPNGWALYRDPFLLETNVPGIFALGDVRHGSVKRVALRVDEESVAVQSIHQYWSRV